MNPRQVTALWIIAVALAIAVALVKARQESARDTATERSPGDTLLEKFPAETVTSVSLTDTKGTITIDKRDDGWVVVERDDYPARTANVLSLLRTIGDLKIVQAMEAGPSFAPRFGMDENSNIPEDRGITATFGDATGMGIARISVGRMLESGGRFVRNHADESGFYAVNDMLHMLDGDPVRWLDDTFLRLEKISSIRVAEAESPDASLWQVTRESEDDDFSLAEGAPGETLESTAGDSLKRLMGFARFQDVVPAAEVGDRTASAPAPRIATVETFEGFTYTITIAPAKPREMDADDELGMPPSQDDQLLTVSVEATLPSERKTGDDETEEAAAELDEAFAERLATLTTRLEKEQALAGRTFLVTKSVVEPLLKNRDDITAGPDEQAAAGQPAAPGPPPAPTPPTRRPGSGGATVTTPPIEIPAPVPSQEEE